MYRVEITKIETKETVEKGPWQVLQRVPWTDKALENATSGMYGERREKLLEREPLMEVRGYAPDQTTEEKVSTQLLCQNVETLDIAAVIKAVNGL